MKPYGIVLILLLFACLLVCGCTQSENTRNTGVTVTPVATGTPTPAATETPEATAAPSSDVKVTAKEVAAKIKDSILSIEASAKKCANAVSKNGVSGEDTLRAIKSSLNDNPSIVSITVLDQDFIVLSAEPSQYGYLLGRDFSQSIAGGKKTVRNPLLSKSYKFVEGFLGISQIYPITANDGDIIGYVDVGYQPRSIIAPNVHNLIADTPYNVWIIETDGTNIFDTSSAEIGNNVLTDEMYQDKKLHEFMSTLAKKKTGSGQYTFRDYKTGNVIKKNAEWATVDYGGSEWRVVLTSPAE